MDIAGLIVFSTALFIAAASPGPGIAAIVARVLGRGTIGRGGVHGGGRHRRRGVACLRGGGARGPGPRVPEYLPRHQMASA